MRHLVNTSRFGARRGFTLIELIVAIGAIALIAVGIAAVFESVGRTVSGGKRVSRFNQFAAVIENQMRADFEAMSRDGVLVVRHQYAFDREPGSPPDIQRNIDDARPRPRRADEVLFMRRGDFTSARAPSVPGMNASSSEAMIHYGHGIRFNPIEDLVGKSVTVRDPRYDRPHVADGREPNRPFRDGNELGSNVEPDNPNRFAGDWALLRRLTLLVPPGSSDQNIPSAADPIWSQIGVDRTEAIDSEIQIAGQPAAASAFRSIARQYRNRWFDTVRGAADDPASWAPMLSSGIIDVATSDMAEIRRIIMDAGDYPWEVGLSDFDPVGGSYILDNAYMANLDVGNPTNNLLHMHAWMEDLFPTDTVSITAHLPQRPRYEPVFPDFVGTLGTFGNDSSTGSGRTRENYRLADQRMLGSSLFVPHCSEFIVEYSFGERNSDETSPSFGETIWHGLDRVIDVDGEAISAARPYPWYDDAAGNTYAANFDLEYSRLDGTTGTRTLDRRLVYGVDDPRSWERLVAHFGFTDPTYTQNDPDVDPATVEWPWPKLIRVTISLADPSDPDVEETFQFVFETPEGSVF